MTAETIADRREKVTDAIKRKWWSFLLLGLVLTIGGIAAIALPVVSTLATALTVGILLAATGLFQVFHAFGARDWRGFLWHLAIGVVQLVGGAMIYLDPFAGAIALTIVIAVVLLMQGATEIGLAFRVRPHDGWGWLLLAGLIAVAAGIILATNLPVAGALTPGILVGISILSSGIAYLLIAIAGRSIVKRLAS